jgi:hypothetical protein
MNRRANNLKQSIAFAAILLALSSLAQNAGLYCYLGACETMLVASSGEDHSCCHHHACHAPEQPAAPCEEPLGHRPDSCPCPANCWCHQAVQAFELPKSFNEPFELTLSGVVAICDDLVAGGVSDQRTLLTWALPPGFVDESAVGRCAKLCRFLI